MNTLRLNVFTVLLLQSVMGLIAVLGIFEDKIFESYNKIELTKMPGRIAIVTGGSSGMGLEIVKMFLKCDMEVVMACRNTTKGEKAVQNIRGESRITTGNVRVMELDNASFDSIKKFVTEFQNNYERLDVLVNNAGVVQSVYKETKDGFEENYGVNYLSHFLLTLLLEPQLRNAGTPERRARVINVSSIAHLVTEIKFEDINYRQNFEYTQAYAQSKLALLLSAKKFARIFNENNLLISVHAVHPGVVNSNLFDNSMLKYITPFLASIFRTKEEGARSAVYAAISPEIEGKSGLYISHCTEWPAKPLVKNQIVQDRLFELSLKQVGVKNGEL